jgi:prevent-host-death family protein
MIKLALAGCRQEFSRVNEIGAFEAKNALGTLLDRVERGEEIVITRHGKAVARLVPHTRRVDPKQALAAFERIRERALRLQKKRSSAFDWPALKKLRDQDRP